MHPNQEFLNEFIRPLSGSVHYSLLPHLNHVVFAGNEYSPRMYETICRNLRSLQRHFKLTLFNENGIQSWESLMKMLKKLLKHKK